MKFGSILTVGLIWCFHYLSMANSSKCLESRFEPSNDDTITGKFKSEWGILGYINRALYRSHDDFSDLSPQDKQNLCACAISKRNQNLKLGATSDYGTILNGIRYSENTIGIEIKYLCFPTYYHPTPDLECTSSAGKVAVVKSFTKKSFAKPQWDIYVADMEGTTVKDFQGIIKNVDLVSTKSKPARNYDDD